MFLMVSSEGRLPYKIDIKLVLYKIFILNRKFLYTTRKQITEIRFVEKLHLVSSFSVQPSFTHIVLLVIQILKLIPT